MQNNKFRYSAERRLIYKMSPGGSPEKPEWEDLKFTEKEKTEKYIREILKDTDGRSVRNAWEKIKADNEVRREEVEEFANAIIAEAVGGGKLTEASAVEAIRRHLPTEPRHVKELAVATGLTSVDALVRMELVRQRGQQQKPHTPSSKSYWGGEWKWDKPKERKAPKKKPGPTNYEKYKNHPLVKQIRNIDIELRRVLRTGQSLHGRSMLARRRMCANNRKKECLRRQRVYLVRQFHEQTGVMYGEINKKRHDYEIRKRQGKVGSSAPRKGPVCDAKGRTAQEVRAMLLEQRARSAVSSNARSHRSIITRGFSSRSREASAWDGSRGLDPAEVAAYGGNATGLYAARTERRRAYERKRAVDYLTSSRADWKYGGPIKPMSTYIDRTGGPKKYKGGSWLDSYKASSERARAVSGEIRSEELQRKLSSGYYDQFRGVPAYSGFMGNLNMFSRHWRTNKDRIPGDLMRLKAMEGELQKQLMNQRQHQEHMSAVREIGQSERPGIYQQIHIPESTVGLGFTPGHTIAVTCEEQSGKMTRFSYKPYYEIGGRTAYGSDPGAEERMADYGIVFDRVYYNSKFINGGARRAIKGVNVFFLREGKYTVQAPGGYNQQFVVRKHDKYPGYTKVDHYSAHEYNESKIIKKQTVDLKKLFGKPGINLAHVKPRELMIVVGDRDLGQSQNEPYRIHVDIIGKLNKNNSRPYRFPHGVWVRRIDAMKYEVSFENGAIDGNFSIVPIDDHGLMGTPLSVNVGKGKPHKRGREIS